MLNLKRFFKYIFFLVPQDFTFCFTLAVEGISFGFNVVSFKQEIPNEIILLCLDYGAALRLEKIEKSKEISNIIAKH